MLGHEFREAVCLGPSWGPPAIIFEPLEPRLLLSGEGGSAAAVADPATGPAARGTSTSPLADLVEGNNEFAFAMYQALREAAGSLFFSPLSISAALSMTFAGAAGNTARQMAETLRFTLPPELHHAVFGSLIDGLQTGAADESADGSSEDAFTLNIANSLWGQYNFPFRDEFVEGLAHHYDGPMYPMDFRADADACRQTINEWVSQHTNERITDLLPEGSITDLTRLVLTNAIYFDASWRYSFDDATSRTFHLPDEEFLAEMMARTATLAYGAGEGYQAVELPYAGGDASMVILLPDEGQFEQFEQSLSGDRVDAILDGMHGRKVRVTMPKFECRSKADLAKTLSQMGMTDAFDRFGADFSNMAHLKPGDQLWIDKVIHEGWISVDTDGTEAAAATAVIMAFVTSSAYPTQPVVFNADRPFVYLIRDRATDSILFAGRVSDASVLTEGDADDVGGPFQLKNFTPSGWPPLHVVPPPDLPRVADEPPDEDPAVVEEVPGASAFELQASADHEASHADPVGMPRPAADAAPALAAAGEVLFPMASASAGLRIARLTTGRSVERGLFELDVVEGQKVGAAGALAQLSPALAVSGLDVLALLKVL